MIDQIYIQQTLKDMLFGTYSKQKDNWILKQKPDTKWFVDKVYNMIKNKPQYRSSYGQYDSGIG